MSDPFVRPDTAAVLQGLKDQGVPPFEALTPEQGRAFFREAIPGLDAEVGALAVQRDLSCPGPAGNAIGLRLHDAKADRAPGPVAVFIHGGGWVLGELDQYTSFCAEMSRTLDMPVVSVDYRLAPEHPFPAAPDDCEAAARWIADGAAELGLSPTGLVIAGDSAGGNLAVATSLALRDKPAAAPVIALWAIYPAVDSSMDDQSSKDFAEGYFLTAGAMEYFMGHYKPDTSSTRAVPIQADLAGLPPTLVHTAGLDPLRDQGRRFAAKCIEAGVQTTYKEANGNIHGFILMRKAIPSSVVDTEIGLEALRDLIADARVSGAAKAAE
ncbi:MAG: alpha/beta hydrolase [Pseudomonadota bacterium]